MGLLVIQNGQVVQSNQAPYHWRGLHTPDEILALVRDASNEIYIQENTSSEKPFKLKRYGADDYDGYIKSGGTFRQVLRSDMIGNSTGGVSGLDSNAYLYSVENTPCVEVYSNHLGTIDNFLTTYTAGNGTVTASAANHSVSVDTGITVASNAQYYTKRSWAVSAKPIMANFLIQSITLGVGGTAHTMIGLSFNFSTITPSDAAIFDRDDAGNWYAKTFHSQTPTSTAIAALSTNDVLSIVVTSTQVDFFRNGTKVASHTTNLPTGDLCLGASVVTTAAGATFAREQTIDMMEIRVFK